MLHSDGVRLPHRLVVVLAVLPPELGRQVVDVVELPVLEDARELSVLAHVDAVVPLALGPGEIRDPDVVAAAFEFVDQRGPDRAEATSDENPCHTHLPGTDA